jgi:hypothetical protein
MKTNRQLKYRSLDERVREHIANTNVRNKIVGEFGEVASEIVRHVRTVIATSLNGLLKTAFDGLEKEDINKIEATISAAFSERQMGLRELASLARKEIAMLVIKRAIPRYRVGNDGVDPLDYFIQFYKEPFQKCDVPANGINSIDPNLHAMLKKRGQFPAITHALQEALPQPDQARLPGMARL